MSVPNIWYFIKFFKQEEHANGFMEGSLYLNTLVYFKKVESECNDGRTDATEAVAMWWQPNDLVINLNVPGIGATEITSKDLAGPVSMAFDYHNYLHLFCLYAVHTVGFECVDGKLDYAPEDAQELQRQLNIDERCLKFGRFAVITPAVPFLDRLREALKRQGCKATAKLVEYYDDEVFHGEIPMADIPFKKQKRFSYQREFRLCVYPSIQKDAAITIDIGDISAICGKVEAARLHSLFEIKSEPAPDVPDRS